MFLSCVGPRSLTAKIESPLHLTIGVLGKTDRAGLSDAFQSRCDIDAVAHQIAVGLLDDVAQMDADPKFYAALRRQAGVALDEAVLHLDGAAHGVDHAAELDEAAVPGALDDATVMRVYGGINQIAPEAPEPRQSSILVSASQPAVSDDIRDQDRRDFPGSRHVGPQARCKISTKTGWTRVVICRERLSRGVTRQLSKDGFGSIWRVRRPLQERPVLAQPTA